MKKIKLLNLFAGIGGNVSDLDREVYEITSVELVPKIAALYESRFPMDRIIVADAMEFLLENYKEFDMIWASPPCPSHSRTRHSFVGKHVDPIYIDMKLYQVIMFLKTYFEGKWVVENVIPYYEPLIPYDAVIDRHFYWSNFKITDIDLEKEFHVSTLKVSDFDDIDWGEYKGRKDTIIRNMVNSNIGLHIMNCAAGTVPYSYTPSLFDFAS